MRLSVRRLLWAHVWAALVVLVAGLSGCSSSTQILSPPVPDTPAATAATPAPTAESTPRPTVELPPMPTAPPAPTPTTSPTMPSETGTYFTDGGLEIAAGIPGSDGLDERQQLAADLGLVCDRLPDKPVVELNPTDNISSTEMLDVRSEEVRTLQDVADGTRPVVVWFWQPCDRGSELGYAEFTAFAHEHQDAVQAIGIGGGGDYAGVQILQSAHDDAVTLLWDDGHAWSLFNRFPTGSLMLFSYDLESRSGTLTLTSAGREVILLAADQAPWRPDE